MRWYDRICRPHRRLWRTVDLPGRRFLTFGQMYAARYPFISRDSSYTGFRITLVSLGLGLGFAFGTWGD